MLLVIVIKIFRSVFIRLNIYACFYSSVREFLPIAGDQRVLCVSKTKLVAEHGVTEEQNNEPKDIQSTDTTVASPPSTVNGTESFSSYN